VTSRRSVPSVSRSSLERRLGAVAEDHDRAGERGGGRPEPAQAGERRPARGA
jgi:hypothetical protein